MRVLQVLPTLSAGGAEGFITNLGVSLANLGINVRFFLMAGVRGERGKILYSRLTRAGIEVVGAEERNIRSPWNVFRLARLIRSWSPHIVQANLYSAEVVTAMARLLSIGSGASYVRRLASTAQSSSRPPWLVRNLDRIFCLTIACSPPVAAAYRGFMNGRGQRRLVTIVNGGLLLDAVPTVRERVEARRVLGISESSFVVVQIGRMLGVAGAGLSSEPKAQDVLLKAFAAAFGGDSECKLVLVGDGPLRSEAEFLAGSLGVAGQTHFLGQQPEPWPALQAADMFCFPSRHEGMPNVLPEAASCGLPVVASDIPEIRSLFPGDAWLLVPVDNVSLFAEAMRFVRENREDFVRKAHAASSGFRESFSMKACGEKYLEAYGSLLGGALPDNAIRPVLIANNPKDSVP